MIEVIDDFLPKEEFDKLLDRIICKNFPWYISDVSDYHGDNNTQLFHILYNNNLPNSDYFSDFQYIYNKLNIFALYKVRLIATLKDNGKSNKFHTDIGTIPLNKVNSKTAIYYINNNDGGTEFENKEIIKSKSNRMVIFDSKLRHRTVKHKTGDDYRYVLNLNYIKIE